MDMLQITEIWNKFLAEEEKDFKEKCHFGKEEITKIGIDKFIKANGWMSPDDVSKWRTDALHIMPCPECGEEFGIFDDNDLGLCLKCLPKFDLEKFWSDLFALAGEDAEKLAIGIRGFINFKSIRDSYRKERRQT